MWSVSALFLLCYLLGMEILNSSGHLLLRIQILEYYIVTLALIKLELIIFYLDFHKVSFAVLRTVLVWKYHSFSNKSKVFVLCVISLQQTACPIVFIYPNITNHPVFVLSLNTCLLWFWFGLVLISLIVENVFSTAFWSVCQIEKNSSKLPLNNLCPSFCSSSQ